MQINLAEISVFILHLSSTSSSYSSSGDILYSLTLFFSLLLNVLAYAKSLRPVSDQRPSRQNQKTVLKKKEEEESLKRKQVREHSYIV